MHTTRAAEGAGLAHVTGVLRTRVEPAAFRVWTPAALLMFRMDALVVGALTATGTVTGMLFWLLLVRPDRLLGLLSDSTDDPHAHRVEWFEDHPGQLVALRVTGAVVVLILGFLTGLAVAFLAGTA